jgi:hypothetical protein
VINNKGLKINNNFPVFDIYCHCLRDKGLWLKLYGYIHRTDYCGIGVLTYGSTGYC